MSTVADRVQSGRGSTGVVRGGRFRVGNVVRFAFLALYVAFLLLPLYWMAVTSIKSQDDQLSEPPVWFPSDPTSINYADALNRFNGWKGLENSLIVAFATTILAVLLGTAAAYSMACTARAASTSRSGSFPADDAADRDHRDPDLPAVQPLLGGVARRSRSSTRGSA